MSFSLKSPIVPFICTLFLVLSVSAQEQEEVPLSKSAKPQGVQQAKPQNVAKESPDAYWIGVRIAPVPSVLLSHFGDTENGAGRIVVEQVIPDGPAAKAGLKRGDVILQLGGVEIHCLGDLVRQVDKTKGTEQAMVVARDGKTTNLTVTPTVRPAEPVVGEVTVEGFPGNSFNPEFPFNFHRPRRMMRQMENAFRQMQGGVDGGQVTEDDEYSEAETLPGGKNKRLDVSVHTGADGKTKVRVTRMSPTKEGKPEKKTWEAESVEKLPDEVRQDVENLFGK